MLLIVILPSPSLEVVMFEPPLICICSPLSTTFAVLSSADIEKLYSSALVIYPASFTSSLTFAGMLGAPVRLEYAKSCAKSLVIVMLSF